MNESRLICVIFQIVEFINEAEMTNSGKMLVINYFQEALYNNHSQKAREAIIRYTQCKTLPSLEEIRQKTADQLTPLEHLLLKMEFEAKRYSEGI
ncbi:MAG: hypothetical protein JW904_01925 [Spirochaetales bacterium]|nr:hypothetical protein [Spirochaetales bacterium]